LEEIQLAGSKDGRLIYNQPCWGIHNGNRGSERYRLHDAPRVFRRAAQQGVLKVVLKGGET
jgi:hypothetical protein